MRGSRDGDWVQILLVEDDARVGAALADVLRLHGVAVHQAATAGECFARLTPEIDAVVLDLGLPDRDGFEVCSAIRRDHNLPILIATARSDLASRVHGLHLGADDYLVKPYDARELLARLHAVRRRMGPAVASRDRGQGASQTSTSSGQVRSGQVLIDRDRRIVTLDGAPIPLSRKEFDVLALLARDPGVVVRREQLLGEIWQTLWAGGGRTLEVHVASIRAKTQPDLIETVRGVGYRLRQD